MEESGSTARTDTPEHAKACAGAPLDLEAADLAGRTLLGADLSGRDLSGRDLSGADLSRADLSGANLSWCNLRGTVLFQANLEGAELMGADLTGANLEKCRAGRAGFGGTKLNGARAVAGTFVRTTFTNAELEEADFSTACLEQARLRNADLSGAVFNRAVLRHADIEASRVNAAVFDHADLRGAHLKGIQGFEKASWIGTDIREVDFTGAYLVRRLIMDENYLYEFRNRGKLQNFVYNVWWITSDCGRSFTRWGLWTVFVALLFAGLFVLVDVDYGDHWTPVAPIYYSVVTLTTLGYGDVVPHSPAAQMLAVLEAAIGYLALGGLLSIFANKMARRAD